LLDEEVQGIIEILQQNLPQNHPYLQVAPKEECQNIQHLEQFLQTIIDQGGEGIILRNPESVYEPGRSRNFLKLKTAREAEAKIIGNVGPNLWECMAPNGVSFACAAGTMEFGRRWQPKVGDIVSFKHHGYLLGSQHPKSPSLHRLRPDLSWDDVIRNFHKNLPKKTVFKLLRKKHKGKGYWKEMQNRIQFFVEFAKEQGFDPLVPDNWYNVTQKQIISKGGRGLLVYYESFKKAIVDAFREVKFSSEWSEKRAEYEKV